MRSNPALWKCLILITSILSALPSSSRPSTVVADSRRTLIRNAALVLTMDAHIGQGDLGIIEKADVLLSGETIAAVGTQLSDGRADVIDATGKFVMPGFVDTHNHLWQSLIRGCGTAQDLNGWLAACVFPLFSFNFSEAEAYAGVRLSTLDLISTGVTTTEDFSHAFTPTFVRGNIRGLNDSGLRSYLPTGDLPTARSSTTCGLSNAG